MNNKLDELQSLLVTNISKVSELLGKKEAEEEEKRCGLKAKTIFAIIGIIVVIAAAAYGLYRFFAPDYLEDFEDDLDDEFEEDFFDDEDVKTEEPAKEPEEDDKEAADEEEPFEED